MALTDILRRFQIVQPTGTAVTPREFVDSQRHAEQAIASIVKMLETLHSEYVLLAGPTAGQAITNGLSITASDEGHAIEGHGDGVGHGAYLEGGTGGGVGAYAVAGTGGGAQGVYGEGDGTGAGGQFVGTGTGAPGVEGFGGTNGNAVHGEASGTGVGGRFLATNGYGVVAESDTTTPVRAALRIVPQDADPSGPNLVGDLRMTTAGVLRVCTVAGTPGTWANV